MEREVVYEGALRVELSQIRSKERNPLTPQIELALLCERRREILEVLVQCDRAAQEQRLKG